MTAPGNRRHPGAAELRAAARSARSVAPALARHLSTCRSCREEVLVLRRLLPLGERPAAGPCPDADALLLFVAGAGHPAPPSGPSASLEAHLSRCLACAGDVEDLVRAAAAAGRVPGAAAASSLDRIRALVSFRMPPSLALVLRGAATPAGAAVRSGVKAYQEKRYRRALSEFGRAREAGEKAPELRFLYGVCLLQARRPTEAIAELAAAVRARAELGEYRWYLAQAYLADGRDEAASRQLRRAARLPGPHREAAAKLLARLAELAGD